MRGDDQQQDGMFSYISPNKRVSQEHPLRRIRSIVDRVLDQLSPRFNKLYARAGRPSIAPEKLLRALLLQLLYSRLTTVNRNCGIGVRMTREIRDSFL